MGIIPLHYFVSEENPSSDGCAPVLNATDGAVGVPKWFIAIVRHNSEKTVAQQLAEKGIETYVATQKQLRLYPSGRRRKIDKVMIPCHVFVRCSETERRKIVAFPYINRFLADRARAKQGLAAPPAIIPENEMDTLRFMLGQTEYPVTFTSTPLRAGDKVQVLRGALRGLQGEVLSPDSSEIIIRLDILGTARVSVPRQDISPV